MEVELSKRLARNRVNYEVHRGRLPRVKSLPCTDCGNPASEYDHYRGYDREHWLAVQPVCRMCHGRRGAERSERPKGDAHHSRRTPGCMARGDQHGARRHPERLARGALHGNAALTSHTAELIRGLYQLGFTQKELMTMYGISRATAYRLLSYRTYTVS